MLNLDAYKITDNDIHKKEDIHGVTVPVVENGHSYSSSIPERDCLHFTLR